MNEPSTQSPFDIFVTEIINQYACEPFDPKTHHPFHCIDAFTELELPLLTSAQQSAFLHEYINRWLSVDESEVGLPPMAYAVSHQVMEDQETLVDTAAASTSINELEEDWEPYGVLAGGDEPIVGMTNMALCMIRSGISPDGEAIQMHQAKAVYREIAAAFFDEDEVLGASTIDNFNRVYTHLRILNLPEGFKGVIASPILPVGVSLEEGVREWLDFDLGTLPESTRSLLSLLASSDCQLEMLRNGEWKPVSGVALIGVKAAKVE